MTEARDPYAETQAAVGRFLDRLVGSRPDDAMLARLVADLDGWSERLDTVAVGEALQYAGNRYDLPSRGRFMIPAATIVRLQPDAIEASVRFDHRFVGAGAAHGGTIALLFDEMLGRLANHEQAMRARTAYLHVDYRAITPLETDLILTARVERTEERKRFVRGELRHGTTLCADVEALFVELRPGQP